MVTTIQIQDDTWEMLKNRKQRPSQTFDDILKELFMKYDSYVRKYGDLK